MVMWVAHIGRVRDHYCRVSEVPERGVIATPRVGKDPTAEGNRKELAGDVVPDRAGEARHLWQGSQITNEPDEVASGRVYVT